MSEQKDSEWRPDYSITPRRIVCTAIRKNGRVICGARHYDKVMRDQIERSEGIDYWKVGVRQGFIDQFGDFLDRSEAWVVAKEQGQIVSEVSAPGYLYSENLY